MSRTLWLVLIAWHVVQPSDAASQVPTPASEILAEQFSVGLGADPEVVLDRVTDAAFARDRIWILEVDRLLAFDVHGELVAEIGRGGPGPGEFLLAARVRVDSLVHVYDPRSARETIFGPDGKLVGTRALSASTVASAAVLVEMAGAELLVTAARFTARSSWHDPYEHVILRTPQASDTLLSIRSSGGLWQAGTSYGVFETELGDGGAWALAGDSLLALVDGYQGTVQWRCAPVYVACGHAVVAGAPGPPREVDRSLLVQLASKAAGRNLREENIIDSPPRRSIATAAAASSDGKWLWVQKDGGTNGGREFLVLDRMGTLRGQVVFDTPVRVYAVGDQGIVLRRKGRFDETVVSWMTWRRWPVF